MHKDEIFQYTEEQTKRKYLYPNETFKNGRLAVEIENNLLVLVVLPDLDAGRPTRRNLA